MCAHFVSYPFFQVRGWTLKDRVGNIPELCVLCTWTIYFKTLLLTNYMYVQLIVIYN
jgi:hypothetical protein